VLARLDGAAWWEGCVLRVVNWGCTVLGRRERERERAREGEGEVEGKEEVDGRRTLKSGLKPAASMAATR
jgi:hypothetical protein